MLAKIALFLLFLPILALSALEDSPWTGTDLELVPYLNQVFQKYSQIDSDGHNKTVDANDYFATTGIYSSYANWAAELASVFAATHSRSFGFDSLQLSGRYQPLSDIQGDFVSLTTGVTLEYAGHQALHDFSSFHHSRYSVEGHVAVGKEIASWNNWLWRYWTLGACGIGSSGSPWLKGILAAEKNLPCNWIIKAHLQALWGLGQRDLDFRDFKGYGAIAHRSLEGGLKIAKKTDTYGSFELGYTYRFYARNFPKVAHLVILEYAYPFGL